MQVHLNFDPDDAPPDNPPITDDDGNVIGEWVD